MALFLLGVAVVATVRLVGVAGAEHAESDHRRVALAEARNALERLAVRTPDELADGPPALPELAERIADELPGGRLELSIERLPGPPSGARIVVAVGWNDRRGRPVPPLRLTTWVFRGEEVRP